MGNTDTVPTMFREVQRFRQGFLWATLIPLLVLLGTGFIYGLLVRSRIVEPLHGLHVDHPVLAVSLGVLTALFGTAVLFFLIAKLIVEVREDGLFFLFSPFHRSFEKVPAERIVSFEALTYRPVREYGGWGIRGGARGRAYNVSGNRGVRLELTDGTRLLIGSQQADTFAAALTRMLHRKQLGHSVHAVTRGAMSPDVTR